MKKLLTIFLIVILCVSFSTLPHTTASTAETELQTDFQTESAVCTEAAIGNSINLYVETYNHLIGAEIDLVIYISLSNEIVNISSSGDGFALADDFQILGDEIHFSVTHTSTSEKPYLSVNVTLDNDLTLTEGLFGVIRDGQLFVDPHAYFLAERAYQHYLRTINPEVNQIKIQTELSADSLIQINNGESAEITSTTSTPDTTITGQILWTDNNDKQQPLRFCRIVVTLTDGLINSQLYEGYTDENGQYYVEFTNDIFDGLRDLIIFVYPEGEDISVRNAYGDLYFDMLDGDDISELNDVSVGTHIISEYHSHCEGITDSPAGWHEISLSMAEHYVDHYEGTSQWCNNTCALISSDGASLNFTRNECKYKGGALAWSEGYATFFGELSQQYFNANYIDKSIWINEIPTFANTYYYAYNFPEILDESAFPIESNTHNGESSELGVQRILYDMYDYSPNEENDNLALGHQTIWNYIMASGATTLYKFIDYYKTTSSAKSQFTYLGEILAAHKLTAVAPTIPSLTADSPTVSFVWDEPNDNGYYNKRKFQVNFYDESYNLIGSTTPQAVTLTSDNGTITVDSDLWETVISSPSCIYVSLTVYECNGDINTPMDSNNITSYESAYSLYFSSSHVHSYTYSFTKYNSSDHKAYCHCGAYIYENHSFAADFLKSTCRNCGYSTTSHVPVIKQ